MKYRIALTAVLAALLASIAGCQPVKGGTIPGASNSITGVVIFYDADGREHKSQDVDPRGPMPMHIRMDAREPKGTHGMDVSTGKPYPTQLETWTNPYTWNLAWQHGYMDRAEIHAQVEHALPGQSIECHFEDVHGEPIPRSAHPQAYDEDDNDGKGGRLDVLCVYSPA